jgi:hypothetical protein
MSMMLTQTWIVEVESARTSRMVHVVAVAVDVVDVVDDDAVVVDAEAKQPNSTSNPWSWQSHSDWSTTKLASVQRLVEAARAMMAANVQQRDQSHERDWGGSDQARHDWNPFAVTATA